MPCGVGSAVQKHKLDAHQIKFEMSAMLHSSHKPLANGQGSRDCARSSVFRSPCLVRSLRPRTLITRQIAPFHVVSDTSKHPITVNVARQSGPGPVAEDLRQALPPTVSVVAHEEPGWRKILRAIATTTAVAVLAVGLVRGTLSSGYSYVLIKPPTRCFVVQRAGHGLNALTKLAGTVLKHI